HHPILMDFGLIGGVNPPDPSAGGAMSFDAFEPARLAMGDTVRYAERMNLVEMEPRDDLSSTGYALADPGKEYLVLQPREEREPFTVTLEEGTYGVEWVDVGDRETVMGDEMKVEAPGAIGFSPPIDVSGPAVLYLARVSGMP
ncbi:MAG: hypothetical protein ACRELC_12970, partial [Gemmatimonadota bacterium]